MEQLLGLKKVPLDLLISWVCFRGCLIFTNQKKHNLGIKLFFVYILSRGLKQIQDIFCIYKWQIDLQMAVEVGHPPGPSCWSLECR